MGMELSELLTFIDEVSSSFPDGAESHAVIKTLREKHLDSINTNSIHLQDVALTHYINYCSRRRRASSLSDQFELFGGAPKRVFVRAIIEGKKVWVQKPPEMLTFPEAAEVMRRRGKPSRKPPAWVRKMATTYAILLPFKTSETMTLGDAATAKQRKAGESTGT